MGEILWFREPDGQSVSPSADEPSRLTEGESLVSVASAAVGRTERAAEDTGVEGGPTVTPAPDATGVVVVRARDYEGRPVPPVQVQVKRGKVVLASGWTDREGMARFAGVTPGGDVLGQIVVESLPEGMLPPFAQDRTTVYGDGAFYNKEHEVRAGEVTEIELTVFRAASVEGYVLGPRDEPVEGAHVAIASMRAGMESLVSRAVTDPTGYFEIEGVYPGLCRPQVDFKLDHPCLSLSRPFPEELEIQPGDRKELVLRLGAGGVRVSGRVIDTEGNGIKDVLVRCYGLKALSEIQPGQQGYGVNDMLGVTSTALDGSFVLEGMPARLVGIVAGLGKVDFNQPLLGAFKHLPRPIRLDLSNRGEQVEIDPIVAELNDAYRVFGQVVMESGWASANRTSLGRVSLSVRKQDGSVEEITMRPSGKFGWACTVQQARVELVVEIKKTSFWKSIDLEPMAFREESIIINIP